MSSAGCVRVGPTFEKLLKRLLALAVCSHYRRGRIEIVGPHHPTVSRIAFRCRHTITMVFELSEADASIKTVIPTLLEGQTEFNAVAVCEVPSLCCSSSSMSTQPCRDVELQANGGRVTLQVAPSPQCTPLHEDWVKYCKARSHGDDRAEKAYNVEAFCPFLRNRSKCEQLEAKQQLSHSPSRTIWRVGIDLTPSKSNETPTLNTEAARCDCQATTEGTVDANSTTTSTTTTNFEKALLTAQVTTQPIGGDKPGG